MALRRICNTSFMAFRTANIIQNQAQLRFFNASAIALREQPGAPNLHTKETKDLNSIRQGQSGKSGPSGGGSNKMMMYALLGVAAAGAGFMLYRSKFVGEKVEEGKNKVAGKYAGHKMGKEFEKAREIVVNVAKEIGGKDLADKVSKMFDEAKDTVQKMAEHYPEAKDKIQKVAGSLGAGGIGKYVTEFDNAKDLLVKEAKKMGGDDVAKKATKVWEDAKDKIQKMATNISENGIEKSAKEFDTIKDYIVKETKKIGGDDLGKKAEKMFDEVKDKIQKFAKNIDEGDIISDSQYQMAKDFVVKEAEKLGGRDLAKKAAKLMDEAKEKIQSIAKEVKKQ